MENPINEQERATLQAPWNTEEDADLVAMDRHGGNLVQQVEWPMPSLSRRLFGSLHLTEKPPVKPVQSEEQAASTKEKRFRISFSEMQRMKLRYLQTKLIKHAIKMYADEAYSEGWEADLRDYVQALKDYDYMQNCNKDPRDPFIATGEYYTDFRAIQMRVGFNPDILAKFEERLTELGTDGNCEPVCDWQLEDKSSQFNGIRETRPDAILAQTLRGLSHRMISAIIGGSFLIAPMWLMVLKPEKYNVLIAATAFVVGFGVFTACWLEGPKEVLAITAAYAAVLVVFVGTSPASLI